MKRPKLAATLRIIANNGPDAFYTGELADTIVREIQNRSGIITKADLANYTVDYRPALSVTINNNYTAYTTHAPTSGPILTFILNILEGYGMKEISTLFYHRLIESFKFAYAKRSELGDPLKINITDVIE